MRVPIAIALLAGCGRLGFGRPGGSDATEPDADSMLGPWGAPTMLAVPGLTNADDPSFTADGLELYFNDGTEVMVSTRASITSPWGIAAPAPGLAGMAYSPHVSADGLTLWGISGSLDLVVSTRVSRTAPWDGASAVAALNSASEEDGPAVTSDGLTMVFESQRAGNPDLYTSTRASVTAVWGAPVPVSELNTASVQARPHLSDDRLTIYFEGLGIVGGSDILFATRPDPASPFGPVQTLVELSSTVGEHDPWVSADHRHFVWSSNRGGTDVLWEARR